MHFYIKEHNNIFNNNIINSNDNKQFNGNNNYNINYTENFVNFQNNSNNNLIILNNSNQNYNSEKPYILNVAYNNNINPNYLINYNNLNISMDNIAFNNNNMITNNWAFSTKRNFNNYMNNSMKNVFFNNLFLENINNMNQIDFIPKNSLDYENSIDNNKNMSNEKEIFDIDSSKLFSDGYECYFPLMGLKNVGLTCYMNSTLQCLLHIPELNYYFINNYPKDSKKLEKANKDAETGGLLSKEYFKLVTGICDSLFNPPQSKGSSSSYNDSYSPKSFNNILSQLNPQFSQYESNDSKDLLLFLFQSMHSELNYLGEEKLKNVPKCNQLIEKESYNFFSEVNFSLNLSIFSYLFYGILKSSTTCLSCKSILYNFQYFQFLSFPIFNFNGKKFNIYQGLKDFIKPEIMKGDNQCYCQKCKGLKDSEINSIIYYTPPYLIINFDYGKDKIYKPLSVEFGEIIDIKGFTDEKCKHLTYALVGVSSHIGRSGDSGHYIAYCKNLTNNQWYEFNDSIFSECEFNKVNSNTSYFLVYKRIDNNKNIY